MGMDNISKKGRLKTINDLKNTMKELDISPKSDEKLKVILDIFNKSNDSPLFDSTINKNTDLHNILSLEDKLDILRIKFSIKSSNNTSTKNDYNLSNKNEDYSEDLCQNHLENFVNNIIKNDICNNEIKQKLRKKDDIELIIEKKPIEN